MTKAAKNVEESKEVQCIKSGKPSDTQDKKQVSGKPEEAMIYCGPSIKNKLRTGDTFVNGLPESIKTLSGNCKSVKRLLVPVSSLIQVKQQLKQLGSVEQISYKKIEEDIKNGRL